MYISIDGVNLYRNIDKIKDALIYNFSIDKLDLPFNNEYGITKNIKNNSQSVISEAVMAEITQMLADRPCFKGVTFKDFSLIGEKAYLVLEVANETLSIPLE